MLTILKAGMCTSVQDAGRRGWRQYGISLSGVLDLPAMRTANLLVGNAPDEPVLEVTLGQFTAEFGADGWIALTGAGCDAKIDGKPLWTGWRTAVRKGQQLKLGMPKHGMRSYLAVGGGLAITHYLGSASTDLKAGFGGFNGRKLEDGDVLTLARNAKAYAHRAGVKQLLWNNRVRAMPGPEYHQFSEESREAFWRTAWQLSPQSNRMGYRLHGNQLQRNDTREMRSHGLVPGIVQVPPSGQPIVLLADAQTTGGYPRIACVIEADLYHMAQLRLGEPVHFIPCTLDEALNAHREQQRHLDQIAWGLSGEN